MVRSKILVLLFVIVYVLCDFVIAANHYCSIESCGVHPHTACMYPLSSKSTSGNNRIITSGLTKEEKQKIINLHNELRQKVATGKEIRGSPGPQPPAKSMPNVEWDDELASLAQKWADQCNFGHDKCRDVQRFKVGQNIATIATSANIDTLKLEDLILMWYNEVEHFNKNDVSRFSNKGAGGKAIGHYTQLIWAKSTKIGCGAVKYKDGGFNRFYLVCNYGPAGNVIGEPIYDIQQ